MATVSGLQPFSEDRPDRGEPLQERVVPREWDPQMPNLRPQAAPVETYFQPQRAPKDDRLARLADALGTFQPALRNFGDIAASEAKEDLPGKIARTIGGKAPAQAAEALAANPELHGKLAQRLAGAQLGTGVADATAEEVARDMAAGKFDRDSGNLDEFLGSYIERDQKLYGKQDPNFAATYRDRFMARVSALRSEQNKYSMERTSEGQDQLAYNAFRGTVNAGIDRGEDPKATFEALRSQIATNKLVMGKPPVEQEKLLVKMLQQLAGEIPSSGQRADALYSMVQTIARTPRKDPATGQDLGPLADSTTLGGTVADILKGARSSYNAQDQNNNTATITDLYEAARTADPNFGKKLQDTVARKPDWLPQNEQTKLTEEFNRAREKKQGELAKQQAEESELNARNGETRQALTLGLRSSLHEVQDSTILDKSGKPVTVTAKEKIDGATAVRMRQLDEYEAANGKGSAFQKRLEWFTENPVAKNDEWKRVLDAGPAGATTATMANGKVVSPATAQGYQLYKQLASAAPNLISNHIDSKNRDFYEVAKAGEEILHLPQSEALAAAARYTNDPHASKNVEDLSQHKLNEKAKSVLGTWWGTSLADTGNFNEVTRRLRQGAEPLVRAYNMTWDQAIDQTAKTIKKDYTVLNGSAVLTAGKGVPQNFGEVGSKYLDGFFEAHGDELRDRHIDKSQLTMTAVNGTNNWVVVDKLTRQPLDVGDADHGISLNELYGTARSMQEAEKAQAAKAAKATEGDRQVTVREAADFLETMTNRGVAIIMDPYSHRFVSLKTARETLAALKANPDYEKGGAVREERKAGRKAEKAKPHPVNPITTDIVP